MNRTEKFLFAFFICIYAVIFHPVADDDENSRFNLVYSIVERGKLNIDAFEDNTVDKAYHQGHYYSDKGVGPALAASGLYFPK